MQSSVNINSDLDYVAILRGIWRRHKRLVVAIFLVVAVPSLTYVYVKSQTLYVSKGMISIEPSALAQLPFLRDAPRTDTIATHMVLLKSRSLSEAVIEALPKESLAEILAQQQHTDYALLLKNTVNRWLGKPLTVLSPQERALAELQLARMEFTPAKEALNVFIITATATKPRVAMDLVNTHIQVLLNRARNVDQEEARKSREFLESQYQQTKESLARSEETATKLQQQKGRVRPGGQTEIELVRLAQLENSLAEAQAGRQVVSARIETLRRSIEQGRSKETKGAKEGVAREDNGGAAGSLSADNLARMNAFKAAQEQLSRLEAKLASMRERYTEAHPLLQVTQEEVTRQQARVAQLARQLPAGPAPRDLASPPAPPARTDERSDAQAQLADLERESESLQAKEETFKLQVARLRGNLRNLSQDEADFGNLRRSVEANRNLLALLSDRLMAARIREQGDSSVVRIVDPASFPVQPTGSKTQQLVLMVLALAGSLAIGAAFGLEYWRRPVETETDVLNATGLSVLGSVGVIEHPTASRHNRRGTRPVTLSAQPPGGPGSQVDSIHLELYRAIRANVETERLKSSFRSIMVTSPAPSEGKSTTILNLAHAFQEFGRRVLVVEADIRRPSLSSPLGLTNKPGLVDFLNGTATFEQVCRPLPSGVIVIPGQVARGDAASLLASSRFRELLDVAGHQFDVILVDSAPVLAVPDNLLLANIIDRVILVAKATGTSARDLRKAQTVIERAGGRILGVVLNQADQRDVPYYHPRYRKYYTSGTGKRSEETPGRSPSPSRSDGKRI
jgi:capsular exopolysaccharide synthesis family protein